ncbi:sulfatase-like hydrolase/transferase [bacterium]|nr:sulfatase-like hydrolase/transferase [bacterium]
MATLASTFVAAVAAAAPHAAAASGTAKPNILFLFADEMDGRILDPSSPQTKPPLPHLQRLARSGAIFTSTYSQSPQCVPSRSAMMVGLRTDQIEVFDNFVGISTVNGSDGQADDKCAQVFGTANCLEFGRSQKAPPTFIDRLATAGYNVSLFGKMHVGAGLDRFQGQLNAWPFNAGSSTKALREWTRGLGPATNTKGVVQKGARGYVVPDNWTAGLGPALPNDYAAVDSCVSLLRGGLFDASNGRNFLYCSILVPHPPYRSNATYMEQVAGLPVHTPEQVPIGALHPNDVSTATLKGTLETDLVAPAVQQHFRRVYFSMCFEADSLLGQVLDAAWLASPSRLGWPAGRCCRWSTAPAIRRARITSPRSTTPSSPSPAPS